MITFKKILVPVDFSDNASQALNWSVNLLKDQPRGEITLLHVPVLVPISEVYVGIPEVVDSLQARADSQLTVWKSRIPAPLKSKAVIEVGDPAEEIVRYAADHKIDLIVMVTAGRHGIARLVHPNLTETVVRLAPCPVLALHLNNLARTPTAVTD